MARFEIEKSKLKLLDDSDKEITSGHNVEFEYRPWYAFLNPNYHKKVAGFVDSINSTNKIKVGSEFLYTHGNVAGLVKNTKTYRMNRISNLKDCGYHI